MVGFSLADSLPLCLLFKNSILNFYLLPVSQFDSPHPQSDQKKPRFSIDYYKHFRIDLTCFTLNIELRSM